MTAAESDGGQNLTPRGWALACALVIFVCQLRPIDDADLFTQIALGWEQLANGVPIQVEPFALVNLGMPIVNLGWLSQLLFAALHEVGGFLLVRCIFAIVLGLSFATLLSLDRIRPTTIPAMFATLISFLAIASNTSVRPQGLALGCFAVLLWLVIRRPKYWLLCTFGVAVLWQNLHPSVGLFFAVACGFVLWCLVRKAERAHCLDWCLVALIAVPASVLTPDGLAVWRVSSKNSEIARSVLQISEWQPPWTSSVLPAMWGFWIALSITVVVWIFVRRVPRLAPAWFVLLFATFYAARFALFWGVVNAAVLAELIMSSRLKNVFSHSGAMISRLPLRTVSCLLIIVPLVFHSGDIISPRIPVRDLESLHQRISHPVRVYNYREWGGSIVYAWYGESTVAIDGRLYLYGKEEWQRYIDIALGRVPVRDIEALYRPDYLILHSEFHKRLIELVDADPGWQRLYTSVGLPLLVYAKKQG
ncbi:MAG: hypothetical protein QY326_02275 [Bdellovibrionota bacterium]|nr:MAG: hypothetical protein QY326_02275 [Bdellovibrionota bacterium]